MPLTRCQSKGSPGWKWGESGKCYIGSNAKKKALAQGRAIKATQFRKDINVPFFFANDPRSKKELIKQRQIMMKAAGQRFPSRTKKPPRILPSKMIEISYYSAILNLISPIRKIIKEILLPRLPGIVEEFKREMKLDAYGETITQLFGDIELAFLEEFTDPNISAGAETFAKRTSDFNARQVDRQFRTVLGVNPIRSEPYLVPQVSAFVERNVALIKSIPSKHFHDIEILLRSRIEQGASTTTISREISEKFSSTKKRARFIARDQIGKFHGKLTELRQREVGVTHYFWRTADDERVRPSHAAVDDKRFSWKNPPSVGSNGEKLHPGMDFGCRCYPEPDLSDFFSQSQSGKNLFGFAVMSHGIV